MISVGVDVSKGKSTVCILEPYGEIVCSPFEVQAMEAFADMLAKLDGEIRVVMEATGIIARFILITQKLHINRLLLFLLPLRTLYEIPSYNGKVNTHILHKYLSKHRKIVVCPQ